MSSPELRSTYIDAQQQAMVAYPIPSSSKPLPMQMFKELLLELTEMATPCEQPICEMDA